MKWGIYSIRCLLIVFSTGTDKAFWNCILSIIKFMIAIGMNLYLKSFPDTFFLRLKSRHCKVVNQHSYNLILKYGKRYPPTWFCINGQLTIYVVLCPSLHKTEKLENIQLEKEESSLFLILLSLFLIKVDLSDS